MSDMDLTIKAILEGDASAMVTAVNTAIDVTGKFRDYQEKATVVGQAFEELLRQQGITIEEWATASQHAAQTSTAWTESQQRAAMQMSALQDSAIKMNAALEESEPLTARLAEALGHFGSVGKEAGEILEGVGDAGAIAGIAVAEFMHTVSEIGEFGNQLSNLRDKTGLSVETLAQWSESAPVFGVSAETMATSVDRLAARVEMGNKQAAMGLKELGITSEEFLSMNQQDRYDVITNGLTDIGEAGHKAAVATELFSRGGLQMLPALTEEAREYREMIEKVSGDTEEIARKGREWTEATNLLTVAWKQLEMATILPLFEMNAGMDKFGEKIGHEIEQIPILGAALVNFRNALHAGDMPDFAADGGVKHGASTTGDQYFEDKDGKGEKKAADAEASNKLFEESEARKAAAAEKAADRAWLAWRTSLENQDQRELSSVDRHIEAANKAVEASKKRNEADLVAMVKEKEDEKKVQDKYLADFTKGLVDGFANDARASKEHRDRVVKDWEDVGAAIGAISGLLQQLGVDADSLAGKLTGAAASLTQGIGSFIKTMGDPSANIFDKVSAGIGLAAQAVGAIVSIFHKPEYKKAMAEVGRDWGVAISEATAKAIEATENSDNVSRQMAELLNLDKIMEDAGGDPAAFADKINNLMEAVAGGAVPAKEGIDQLGKAFTDLQTAADGGSVASEAAMVKMIERARELGEHIPEIDAAVAKMLDDAMQGLDEFYKGLAPGAGGKSQGAASATLFGAVYEASAGSLGLAATFDKFKDTFEDLKKSLAPGTHLTGGAAEFAELAKLMKNEHFSGAARGAEGLAKTTKGLMDEGGLSQKVVDALSKSTETLYGQALKGAKESGLKGDKADDAALKAILPELVQLQKAQAMGAKLTPEETALLAKAQAEGLLPMKDIQTQQLETLRQIAANTGGGGGAGAGGGRPGDVHAAEGFFSPSMPTGPRPGGGTGLTVHPGERVEVTAAGRNRGAGGTHVTVAPQLHVGTLIGSPDDVIDMIVRAAQAGHPDLLTAIRMITHT